jgi:hypothetical protein
MISEVFNEDVIDEFKSKSGASGCSKHTDQFEV